MSTDVGYIFRLTSQLSHQTNEMIPVDVIFTNSRYTELEVTFPIGFGAEHKNGIYNYEISSTNGLFVTNGLVKIVCEPGGAADITNYESTPATEERQAKVYYRPNY